MDIDTWLSEKNSQPNQPDTPVKQDNSCPPCPACPTIQEKPKYLRIPTSQLFYDIAHAGKVVDEDRAKSEDCKFITLDSGKKMYWVPGAIGVMGEQEAKKYCNGDSQELLTSRKMSKLLDMFEIASAECMVGKSYNGGKIGNTDDRIRCMYGVAGGEL